MLAVKSRHPHGSIILGTGRQPRFNEFWHAMENLMVPGGSKLIWNQSYDVAWNRNQGLRDGYGDWAWFMDDDHTFNPDCLMKLLEHDVQVVGPVASRCKPPYEPIACTEAGPLTWNQLWGKGLMKAPPDTCLGIGGLLVRRKALDKVADPWFRVGQYTPDRQQEDTWFCNRLIQEGFTIHIDRDTVIGHTMSHTVIPKQTDDGWEIHLI